MTLKGDKWLRRKAVIRQSATLDGRKLADAFAAEGRALGYTVDHIIPLSKGGRHHRGNLQWLSHADNVAKGDSLDWHHPGGIDCTPYMGYNGNT